MSQRDLKLLREAALELESQDVDLAYGLMSMAKKLRPSGKFINQKIEAYRDQIERSRNEIISMVNSGDLAVIPSGSRVRTH